MHLEANHQDHNPLIPLTSTGDGMQAVIGRDLHQFLEIQSNYTTWIARLIEKYRFIAGQDYLSRNGMVERQGRGSVEQVDHVLTLDMAKEVSMVQNNEKGRQARRYFIECERRAKEAPALSGKQLMAAALLEAQSTMQELETTVQAQATQLEVAAPKVTYHDTYVAESDQLSFRTVASTLEMGEKALRNLLIEKGWIYKETSSRRSQKTGEIVPQYRYSEYADKKPYFIRRQNHDAPRFRGEVDHTLKITPAGAAAIKRAVGKWLRADQPELEVGGRNAA
ncbi:antA/AntB antirepressor family protein [Corynebacterium callunae]|uniref:antA/AntB antirepressor family protein n=1 Tax=Corynebacterium callunae TaxID=1721 RepID=UPI00200033F9|nr:antA/AntB antirepressor family protein [Corynebacterium callunae]MCK2200218.1 antA/AntB antirepressor family protein [Corynebacterium callunae]